MTDKAFEIKDKDFFIKIPKSVATDRILNDTDCYVFGALNSYVNIPTYKTNGIPLYTTKLAKRIGISVRVLLYTLKNISDHGLITLTYDAKIKRRRIFLRAHHDDAYVLIPHDVVNRGISIPSKIFYGKAFAARNGYAYQSIKEIADYTGYHKSSVYRHISELVDFGLLKRDLSSMYRWLPNDVYSVRKRAEKGKSKDKVYATGQKANQRLANAPPSFEKDLTAINPDDQADMALDTIFKRIR